MWWQNDQFSGKQAALDRNMTGHFSITESDALSVCTLAIGTDHPG
jgi:hypothetical protein